MLCVCRLQGCNGRVGGVLPRPLFPPPGHPCPPRPFVPVPRTLPRLPATRSTAGVTLVTDRLFGFRIMPFKSLRECPLRYAEKCWFGALLSGQVMRRRIGRGDGRCVAKYQSVRCHNKVFEAKVVTGSVSISSHAFFSSPSTLSLLKSVRTSAGSVLPSISSSPSQLPLQ